MYNYVDKYNRPIHEGDIIKIGDDDPEMVYSCFDQYGQPDLGVNASNEAYLEAHPWVDREFYSLRNFSSTIIEIVDD